MTTPVTATLADDLLAMLRDDYDAPPEISVESSYEDLDFDSLVLVEVAVALSQKYDIDVTDSEMMEVGTVAATIDLLRSKGVAG